MRAPAPLRASGVEVRYGAVVAVHPATFAVPPGGMLAVTGPSGAGKSSLLWALAGATAHSGTVDVGGVRVQDRDGAAARGIALTPQGNGLPSFLTAEENVLMPLLAAGEPVALDPYQPVLRGMLLTGRTPLYLRNPPAGIDPEGAPGDGDRTAPWWPPHKIAGAHLAPYLATHSDLLVAA